MRGTTLGVLIQMLRRELKVAESPALGKNTREGHAHALRSAQDRLFVEHDWPFKLIQRDITMAAGQRYYAPPTDMDIDNIRDVNCLYSGQYSSVTFGITTADYNEFNSDTDARMDPVLRWQFYNDPDDNTDMIEAWPLPASDGGSVLRFDGQRKLKALVADGDTCELDDLLIVLTAAADLCDPKEQQRKEAKAARHLFNLKRKLADTSTFVSGGGYDPKADRGRRPARVVISPSASGN